MSAPTLSMPRLLHVDDHLLVALKPAGLLAVPGLGAAGLDHLAGRVQALHPDARVVHRLDMSTSGLMLFARGAAAQRALGDAFAQRRIAKRYIAVVEGLLQPDEGVIEAPLAADWPRRPRQRVDLASGKASTTRWRVLSRGVDCTRVELEPVTGRTHQLRVHLQHIGHAVRGDALYAAAPLDASRLLLHASMLSLPHPHDGRPMTFDSVPDF